MIACTSIAEMMLEGFGDTRHLVYTKDILASLFPLTCHVFLTLFCSMTAFH